MGAKQLEDKKILLFVDNLFEDLELYYPFYRLIEEGAKVIKVGEKANEIYQSKHNYPCKTDLSFSQVKYEDFHALIIPGGYAPDKLRRYPAALDLVRQFHRGEKLIAFICHAGWVPISAKVLKGVHCTSFHAIKDDMINAGALWVDEPVVVDRHFISSRTPEDLPFFSSAIIHSLISKK
jgi:protease I